MRCILSIDNGYWQKMFYDAHSSWKLPDPFEKVHISVSLLLMMAVSLGMKSAFVVVVVIERSLIYLFSNQQICKVLRITKKQNKTALCLKSIICWVRVYVLFGSRLPDDPKALWDGHCLESHILAAVDRVHPQQVCCVSSSLEGTLILSCLLSI